MATREAVAPSTASDTTTPAFGVAWARDIGAAGLQLPFDVAAGSSRSFLAGIWNTTIDFHDGPRHAPDSGSHPFIAAVDARGEPIWHRSFGAGIDFSRVAATADDDVIVAGSRTGSQDVGCGPIPQAGGFLAKYAGATGLCLWMRVWPASVQDNGINAVKTEPNGDLAIAGNFHGTVDLGNGNVLSNSSAIAQVFVARLDSRGHAIWARVLGDPSAFAATSIQASDLSTDDAGNVYFLGTFKGRTDLAGQTIDIGPDTQVTYLLALDGGGAARWRYLDATETLTPASMDVNAGRLAIFGNYDGPFKFGGAAHGADGHGLFVANFGLDGHQRWAQTLGGTSVLTAGDIVVDAAQRIQVVGEFFDGTIEIGSQSFSASGATVRGFIATLDGQDGTPLRTNRLGADGGRFQEPRLAFGPTGQKILSGIFKGTATFGSTVLGPTDAQPDGVYMALAR